MKKLKKPKQKKKQTTFSTQSEEIKPPALGANVEPEALHQTQSVSSEQVEAASVPDELKRLEAELSAKPQAGAKPVETKAYGIKESDSEETPGPKRRRRFKRPPPENTIRMAIRQYWRFRTWLANRKIQLPPDVLAAVLDGTDQLLVEPLVEPVIGIIDEYIPEQWIEFIEEKSPILTFLIALFEAEQTFSARLRELANEIKQVNQPQQTTPQAAPASRVSYPKRGEL